MSKASTEGQALAVTASVAVDTDWQDVDGAALQRFIELPPKERGVRVAAFFNNGGNLSSGSQILRIDRSKPFNLAEFIGAGWSIWRGPAEGDGLSGEEEQNKFSLALTEIDLNKIVLVNTLKSGETTVTGEERVRRLNANNRTSLDAKIFQTLWENRDKLPERFKQKTNGNTTYIFCDGTVLRSPCGGRCVLCFYWCADSREWSWNYNWQGDHRFVNNPSAVLAS